MFSHPNGNHITLHGLASQSQGLEFSSGEAGGTCLFSYPLIRVHSRE